MSRRASHVLPGFGLTLGFTLFYTGLVVLLPLAALLLKSASIGWSTYWGVILDPRVQAAFRVSFSAALAAASLNAIFGSLVAWVLVRYTFPGKRLIDALVDLPFALPTAVSGISLATLFAAQGWVGRWASYFGIELLYRWLGIVLALTLIGLPFVVRSVQPALEDLELELEEAAASLGAGRLAIVRRVVLPTILPALLTGFAMAFARALGEYGSVIFVAGNLPLRTEVVPLLIVIQLEQYEYGAATAIAVLMLALSFVLLLTINFLQWWSRRYRLGVGR